MRISNYSYKMKIHIKSVLSESFADYKKCSMLICGCTCTWKCREKSLPKFKISFITNYRSRCWKNCWRIYEKFTYICYCIPDGLEWFDQYLELLECVDAFREKTLDDIIIYTGYNKNEIEEKIILLKKYSNIIIKYGRFIPGQQPHFDEVLGVNLASDNQYAEKLS